VFDYFRSLALRLKNEHPSYLKTIHSDNGTEFRNAYFDQFCLEHGVDQQFSAPACSLIEWSYGTQELHSS
jgi:transposase InsO family protein